MRVWRWLQRLLPSPRDTLAGVRFVVVGLGNPGEDYANTRHNVGFMVVDELAGRCGAGVARRVGGAEVRRSDTVPSGPVAFAKPLSFMNRSGGPSLAVLRAAGCSDSQCIVVVDDVNLPLGRIRVRRGGSDGGHNGLKSMIAAVGEGFPRVRVGVGPVAAGESLVDFVLGQFAAHEVETVHDAVGRAADAVLCAIADGVEAAMSRYNR